jgi:hypothetical protein
MPALNVISNATSLTIELVLPTAHRAPLIDAKTLRLARYGIVTAAENTVTTVMQAAALYELLHVNGSHVR